MRAISGAALQHAEVARLIGALGIEISTGLKVGRFSQMQQAAKWSGSAKRTKKGALEDLVLWYYTRGGALVHQWGTVTKALGEERAMKLRKACERSR